MRKIPTLFDRDWDGHRGVVPRFSPEAAEILAGPVDALYPTEKLDGTSVRLTVRGETLVRVEKRRNPSKSQCRAGITEPWYAEASEGNPADRWVVEAAACTDLCGVPDGEHSGEAVGPKIQGNPLGLDAHTVVLFDLVSRVPTLYGCPRIVGRDPEALFDALRYFIIGKPSALNPDRPIEGVVWHSASGEYLKLKAKDFR